MVGGGDVMVMFKDNPAARALIEYLATPEAAEIWAAKGGFSSPNKNVDTEVYPDELTKQTATELANAEVFRFDMSDLMPGAFGSDSLFTLLQDFVKNPDDVDGIATEARGGGGVGVQRRRPARVARVSVDRLQGGVSSPGGSARASSGRAGASGCCRSASSAPRSFSSASGSSTRWSRRCGGACSTTAAPSSSGSTTTS